MIKGRGGGGGGVSHYNNWPGVGVGVDLMSRRHLWSNSIGALFDSDLHVF
jgi:hypothetical protein